VWLPQCTKKIEKIKKLARKQRGSIRNWHFFLKKINVRRESENFQKHFGIPSLIKASEKKNKINLGESLLWLYTYFYILKSAMEFANKFNFAAHKGYKQKFYYRNCCCCSEFTQLQKLRYTHNDSQHNISCQSNIWIS
jgi:hypothetical protein